jgi:broad specificity phosphatase PhoE
MPGIGGLQHQHGVRLAIGAKTSQVSKGRLWAEPVVGVVGADLEPTCGNDQPIARKLSTDPFPAPPGRDGRSKLIWEIFGVRRPAFDDEFLEGIRERDLAVRQLGPSIAHMCHCCTGPIVGSQPELVESLRPTEDASTDTVNRMPTRLFLVRHGETEWSRSGRHTSITDLPLTETGKKLARAIKGHLSPQDFQLIRSSPRRRALETAELAGFVDAYEPEIDNDLAEWFYGDYEGKTSKEIWETVPGWTIWNGEVPSGETAAEVAGRLDRVVARVRESGVDQAICFGHGHALRALTMRWLGFDLSLGVHFPLDTGTVSVLGEDRGAPALERWNARP